VNKEFNNPGYTSAQLVYVYLDRDFNVVEHNSGALAATEEGVLASLAIKNLRVEVDGFYIFLPSTKPPHI